MVNQPKSGEIEEQAARIRHAEEEAGLKPMQPDHETIEFRDTPRGYRVGTEFVFTVLAFLFVGLVVDRWLGTGPWGLLLLMMAGFGIGMMNLWRAMNRSSGGDSNGQDNKE
jgi:ATP synthase protein I